jgi:hypothetical protein
MTIEKNELVKPASVNVNLMVRFHFLNKPKTKSRK